MTRIPLIAAKSDVPAEHHAVVDHVMKGFGALRGPAGGEYGTSPSEPSTLDAVEFCRLLSGRGHGEGLLAVQVGY